MILPVIMAGGSGTRLWPLSRALYPKQFLNIVGENTMLQDTLLRLANVNTSSPLVICNDEHRFLVAEQLREVGLEGEIILEPEGRNTAPAIALAALHALKNKTDPLLLVLAADHVISNISEFELAVSSARDLALDNKLVTFGIVAQSAETGYGYIKKGDSINHHRAFKVQKFAEKPDVATANAYLKSGNYFWNSGMFMFKASRYIKELTKYHPDIVEICQQSIQSERTDLDFIRIDSETFSLCPSESIDYAVMEPLCSSEQGNDVVVVPLDAGWSDIGSWSAIWEVSEKDECSNQTTGDVISEDSNNCLVHGEERLISILGLENIVIVDTKDALLVADKSKVQDVKKVVDKLKSANREEWKIHREVYRPWGKYDSIDVGSRYQVKRITVNPGAKLSVQMHHHRAEHWIVVSGTARVTNGDKIFLVSENESTYIPIGCIHALENPGKVPLELIEVQTGSYLGEDDIVRLEDNYGRA